MSAKFPTFDEIFVTNRLSFDLSFVSMLLYTPFGIVLTLARVFLSLNYLCCQIVLSLCLSSTHPIQHFVQRVFLIVLGVVVYKENEPNLLTKPTNTGVVTVCNRIMNIDEYVLPCWLNGLVTTKKFTLSAILQNILRKFPCTSRQYFDKLFEHERTTVIHFPEDCPSSEKALLNFNDWIFSFSMPIQPCCIKVARFLPIKPTVADSNFMTDMLWCFFCPFTVYKVKVLPAMHRDLSEESSLQFAIRVQKRMATEMKMSRTCIVQNDRDEFIKKKNIESRHLLLETPTLPDKYYPEDIKVMVRKVKEVVDKDIPFDVIAGDLLITNCVESTISNIIEGVVKYTSIHKAKFEKELRTFENSPAKRQMSFNERKKLFIQEAQERYLKNHPEYKKTV